MKATNPGLKISALHFQKFQGKDPAKAPMYYGEVEIGNAFWFSFRIGTAPDKKTQQPYHFVTFPQREGKPDPQRQNKKSYFNICGIIDFDYDKYIKDAIVKRFNNGDYKDFVSANGSNWNERNAERIQKAAEYKSKNGGANVPAGNNNDMFEDEAPAAQAPQQHAQVPLITPPNPENDLDY